MTDTTQTTELDKFIRQLANKYSLTIENEFLDLEQSEQKQIFSKITEIRNDPKARYVAQNVFIKEESKEVFKKIVDSGLTILIDDNALPLIKKFYKCELGGNIVLFNQILSEEGLKGFIERTKKEKEFIGIGAGHLQDICKYITTTSSANCCIIPSALSTHVYSSKYIHAHKVLNHFGVYKSIRGEIAPVCMLLNDFLEYAHERIPRLIKCGMSDLFALKTATIEWQFGPQYKATTTHKFAVILSNYAIDLMHEFNETGDLVKFILAQNMLNLITEVVGSPPASGTEHLYANTIEKYYKSKLFHGELVAAGIMVQMSTANIFPRKQIIDEMKSLQILPNEEYNIKKLEGEIVDKMKELAETKERFSILSLIR